MAEAANPMRSVQRSLDVLTTLQSVQHPLRLTDIARRTGLHIATAQRVLAVLVEAGFAARYGSGYTCGPAALSLAHSYLVSSPLTMVAQPVMHQLSADTGLTSSLYVPVGQNRVLVARVEGSTPLRYTLPIGERLPIHLGAAGKAILASLDSGVQDAVLADLDGIRRADGDAVDPAALRAELAEISAQGYAVSLGERVAHVAAVAAPILDSLGSTVGALGVSGPADTIDAARTARLSTEIRLAATAISARYPVAA